MARVSAYQTSDGILLPTRQLYLRHEANLIVAAKLAEVIPGAVRAKLGEAASQEAVDAKAAEVQEYLVKHIGLNTIREFMEIKFKPSAADGEGDGDPAPAAAPAAAAGPTAPAVAPAADGEDAAI